MRIWAFDTAVAEWLKKSETLEEKEEEEEEENLTTTINYWTLSSLIIKKTQCLQRSTSCLLALLVVKL